MRRGKVFRGERRVEWEGCVEGVWFFLHGGAASGLSGGLPSDGLAGDS